VESKQRVQLKWEKETKGKRARCVIVCKLLVASQCDDGSSLEHSTISWHVHYVAFDYKHSRLACLFIFFSPGFIKPYVKKVVHL
jgi:hypothetical protein